MKWIVGGLIVAFGGYAAYRYYGSQKAKAVTVAATQSTENVLGINVYNPRPAPSRPGQLTAFMTGNVPGSTVPNSYSPPLGPLENQPDGNAICNFELAIGNAPAMGGGAW